MEIKNNFFNSDVIKSIGKDKLILIAIAGIVLIVCSYLDFSQTESDNKKVAEDASDSSITKDDYVAGLEDKLKDLLQNVNGAGKCQVMITLKSSNEKILQSDVDTTNKSETGENTINESNSSSKTLILKGEEDEKPYVIKEIMPEIEGVVVVAEGAGNEKVNLDITKIIQALFNVEAHKISIIKMK